MCVDLSLGFLFCSIDLDVCLCASTILSWWLQALLQSHSHQDSMVLAQRQKSRSMEQNRKPRDKSTHLWTSYLQQKIYFLSQTHQLSSEMSPLIAQQCEPLCALKPSLFALLRAAVVGDGGVWWGVDLQRDHKWKSPANWFKKKLNPEDEPLCGRWLHLPLAVF